MRLRDNPIIEVSRKLPCTPERAWELVTDITLPTRAEGELQAAEWIDGADAVAVGARFVGRNSNDQMGEWETLSIVTEVEEGRRWAWSVGVEGSEPWATWGFEVDPSRVGAVVRQWARVGDGDSPFRGFIAAAPEKEGVIIDNRLGVWRRGMESNLDLIEAAIG
ncbi:SRPBCC family protein [Gordonia sp. (in: high G+C Gram-positive bacteria)]|uniref:SRPBCC family protein n=1 Tax=Gordonia sp. (in: high G+C Gram-positive bacteria) TaxID=84139 RepID=UPI0016A3C2CE|nr:SRPBCC family protein [Gordonia sp. (in: high G+C Gram-positive bacteria)]NLG45515.1 SRPBCC family protein [Gordonia sp. (in: high G+C Gram-positive bacteria)]